MTGAAASQKRLGPILLSQGVTPAQVAIFLTVILCANFSSGFMNLVQPLLITELLHVPAGQQGVLMGALTTTQHFAVLLVISVAGVLSDRIGRRWILILALTGFLVSMWVYPLVAAVWMLFAVRFLFGVSTTGLTAGGATKIMDYPDNRSRGKFISLMMVVQAAAAAIFMTLVSRRVVAWLRDLGLSDAEAIRYGFWAMSLITILGVVIAAAFLAKDAPPGRTDTATRTPGLSLRESIASIGAVFAEARKNPRLAVVLLIGGVIRTDSVILQAFLGLWIVQAGRQQGVDPIEATKTIGLLLAIGQISGFVTPPLFGWLADRVDRLILLNASLAMTAVAFCSFGLVHDVFGYGMIICAVMVGLAEGAQSISANALLGEECPPRMRGRAIGVFTFLGTLSVLAISLVAGALFDKVGHAAPFVMEGALNLLVCIVVVLFLVRANRRRTASLAR